MPRPDIADRSSALQTDICAGILFHAIAKHGNHVIVGNNLAFGGHVAQLVDRLDANTRILVVHERIEQRLPDDILRFRTVQRFERLQPYRSVTIFTNRVAKSLPNFGIVIAHPKQIHCLQAHVRAECLVAAQDVKQYTLYVGVIHGALHRNRLFGFKLQLHFRRIVSDRRQHIHPRYIGGMKIQFART